MDNSDQESKRKLLTDQQIEFFYYMLDITRDTTLDGSPRCEYQYVTFDDFYHAGFKLRCTAAARLMVLITTGHGEPYWQYLCHGCCPPHSERITEMKASRSYRRGSAKR